MENYQVILLPGSKQHSAHAPLSRSPSTIPSPRTRRSVSSVPQAPSMHTLRFIIQAAKNPTWKPILPNFLRSTGHSEGPGWLCRHLPPGYLHGIPHTPPSRRQAASCLRLCMLKPDPSLSPKPNHRHSRKYQEIRLNPGGGWGKKEKEKRATMFIKLQIHLPPPVQPGTAGPLLPTTAACHHSFSCRWQSL